MTSSVALARWLTCVVLLAAAACGAAAPHAHQGGSVLSATSGYASDAGWRPATTSADDHRPNCVDVATVLAAQVGGAEDLAAHWASPTAMSMHRAVASGSPKARTGTPATGVGLNLAGAAVRRM